jgi:hypothetical protein
MNYSKSQKEITRVEELQNDDYNEIAYSRNKCFLFHTINLIAVGLIVIFFTFVLKDFSSHLYFQIFFGMIPLFFFGFSLFIISRHDLTHIHEKKNYGINTSRDNIEFAFSMFAKRIYFTEDRDNYVTCKRT